MEKIIVYGAGKLGEQIVHQVGPQRIAYIVDASVSGDIFGIPVYAKDWFEQHGDRNAVILVTPQKYENDIREWFLERGFINIYLLSEEFPAMICVLRQLHSSFWKNIDDNGHNLLIHGKNKLLKLLVLDIMSDNDVSVTKNIDTVSDTDDISDCVVISVDSEEENLKNETGRAYKWINIHELISDINIYHNSRLEQFRNCHKGKRCFIVATGPSLRIEDIEALKSHGEICISVNGIVRAFDKTDWRPDYFAVSDVHFAMTNRELIKNMDCKAKFIADIAWCFDDKDEDIYRWHLNYDWTEGIEPEFSGDFANVTYRGRTVVYDGALQLAAYMGFDSIYLLGTDCTRQKEQGTTPHFYEVKKGDAVSTVADHIDDYFLAYASARKFADSHGFKIYNATRGGNLEVFERVDFDSLFE